MLDKISASSTAATRAEVAKELRILESLAYKLKQLQEMLASPNTKPNEALSECETLLGYCPESNVVRTCLADALIACKKYDQARALLNSLYNEEKTNVTVMILRGIALLYTGNVANALKHFQVNSLWWWWWLCGLASHLL
jgi:predicted Zn-dependent protease